MATLLTHLNTRSPNIVDLGIVLFPALQTMPNQISALNDLINLGIAIAMLIFIAWFVTKHMWPFFKDQITAMQQNVIAMQKALLEITSRQSETNSQIVSLLAANTEQLARVERSLTNVQDKITILAHTHTGEKN